jgi:hypothetical protein
LRLGHGVIYVGLLGLSAFPTAVLAQTLWAAQQRDEIPKVSEQEAAAAKERADQAISALRSQPCPKVTASAPDYSFSELRAAANNLAQALQSSKSEVSRWSNIVTPKVEDFVKLQEYCKDPFGNVIRGTRDIHLENRCGLFNIGVNAERRSIRKLQASFDNFSSLQNSKLRLALANYYELERQAMQVRLPLWDGQGPDPFSAISSARNMVRRSVRSEFDGTPLKAEADTLALGAEQCEGNAKAQLVIAALPEVERRAAQAKTARDAMNAWGGLLDSSDSLKIGEISPEAGARVRRLKEREMALANQEQADRIAAQQAAERDRQIAEDRERRRLANLPPPSLRRPPEQAEAEYAYQEWWNSAFQTMVSMCNSGDTGSSVANLIPGFSCLGVASWQGPPQVSSLTVSNCTVNKAYAGWRCRLQYMMRFSSRFMPGALPNARYMRFIPDGKEWRVERDN